MDEEHAEYNILSNNKIFWSNKRILSFRESTTQEQVYIPSDIQFSCCLLFGHRFSNTAIDLHASDCPWFQRNGGKVLWISL